MDAHRVAEVSEGTGSQRVDGEYQTSSVGYTLDVNTHHVNNVAKLRKAYLGISHYYHYLQWVIGSKMNTHISLKKKVYSNLQKSSGCGSEICILNY